MAQCNASRRANDGGESLAPTLGLPTSFATPASAALNFVVGGAKILPDLSGSAQDLPPDRTPVAVAQVPQVTGAT